MIHWDDAYLLGKLLKEHERSGYLGELLGTIVDVKPTVRTKLFLVVRFWDIVAQILPSTLLAASALWLCLHGWLLVSGTQLPEMDSAFWDDTYPGYEFWYDYLAYVGSGVMPGSGYFPERLRAYLIVNTIIGVVATLGSLGFLAIVRNSRGIEGRSFEIDFDKLSEQRVVSRTGPLAAVVTVESITLEKDGRSQILRRFPTPGRRLKAVGVGELVCFFDDKVLYQCDLQELLERIELRLQSIQREQREERERDQKKNAYQAKVAFERREAEKYAAEQQKRMERNQDHLWRPNASDALVRTLPADYAPLASAGLAYANVVAYATSPPFQIFNEKEKRWETVGHQNAQQRGVYLIGVSSQRTVNRHPLVVGPHLLPGTTSGDLVIFVLDKEGHVRYFANPARWEIEDRTTSDGERANLDRLKPMLRALYEQALKVGPQSSGWA